MNAGDLRDICSFCAEIERRQPHNLFQQILGPGIGHSYLLRETQNFVVMPGIGSLADGYLLVVPRQHVLSFGYVPEHCDGELNDLLSMLVRWLQRRYSPAVVCFEHGAASFTARGGSCTDHAHLHITPVSASVDLLSVMTRDFEPKQIPSMASLRDQVAARIPYLFLRNHDGRMYVCNAPNAKSQHLRRDLAMQLGLGEVWDWLVFPGSEHISATIQAYKSNQNMSEHNKLELTP